MKEIYFIRHGQSRMNVENLWAGHTDTPLTPKGIEQAKKAGREAREQGLVFDLIISSPLKRAHHTAKHIARHIGYPEDSIELNELLKERNFGELEGKNLELHFNIPIHHYVRDPYAIDHLVDIEKIEDLHRRVTKVLEDLLARPEKRILLVSHGAFGRSLRRAVEKLPLHAKVEAFDNAVFFKLM